MRWQDMVVKDYTKEQEENDVYLEADSILEAQREILADTIRYVEGQFDEEEGES